MRITFIGSGNVATHLAKAFYGAGHEVVQVWSREFDHAEALASQVMAEPIDNLSLLYPDADCYVLAVKDDVLFDLALDLQMRNSIVVHTSGTVALSLLRPISRRHGVLYVPQTFVRWQPMDYSQLPFCLEGSDEDTLRQLEALASSVSPLHYRISSEQRRWLHLGAVMVNNFGNALNAMSASLMEQHAIPFSILQPLIETTTRKALAAVGNNTAEALWHQQTGPAVRQDEKTLDRHRAMLKDQPDMLQLYNLLTTLIHHNTHRQSCD
ncbi:MAG: DUF2520 domain-containing protein [Bacteroidales bacterium]|nr:DUF2520 domain-containing protein [Bacteroidales bacterium]